jgi:hypothetical protein
MITLGWVLQKYVVRMECGWNWLKIVTNGVSLVSNVLHSLFRTLLEQQSMLRCAEILHTSCIDSGSHLKFRRYVSV